MHDVWNGADGNLILLKGKLLCWKEVSSRVPHAFVVGLVIFCNSTYTLPPPQPHRFLRGFLPDAPGPLSTKLNVPWTLSCITQLVGAQVASLFPWSQGNPQPGLQTFAPGRASVPSECRDGDASHFPRAWTISKEFHRATQTPQNLLDSSPIDSTARSSFNW